MKNAMCKSALVKPVDSLASVVPHKKAKGYN